MIAVGAVGLAVFDCTRWRWIEGALPDEDALSRTRWIEGALPDEDGGLLSFGAGVVRRFLPKE